MYEPFSNRARKVMQLANQEAMNLNHGYIGTEHILLGLLKEGGGTAARALENLDVNLRRLRSELEKLLLRGPEFTPPSGQLPPTPRVKRVIENAIEECVKLKHKSVGTEHILLGAAARGGKRGCASAHEPGPKA